MFSLAYIHHTKEVASSPGSLLKNKERAWGRGYKGRCNYVEVGGWYTSPTQYKLNLQNVVEQGQPSLHMALNLDCSIIDLHVTPTFFNRVHIESGSQKQDVCICTSPHRDQEFCFYEVIVLGYACKSVPGGCLS